MLLTFLLPVAIWTLPLLLLWLTYARACRNYIERHQPSSVMLAPAGEA